ncbi:GGDEF domain-containing protein [Sagittula sp. S175]|uniref:GGDEF domain-containing protein n=1 Tax=Sagittula sp. S175 TaxID=3415129 RepID=UPI003C7A0076
MTIPEEALHALCPMHAVLGPHGHIRQAGSTLHKLSDVPLEGARFLEVFEVYRPRAVGSMAGLLQTQGRKLHLRLREGRRTALKGMVVATGDGGAVVNLSFGIGLRDGVRDFALTSTDFAPTDIAIEMLWLMEAKSAAMDASRSLNTRLKGAMTVAEERAFTDALTGLRNRRALDATMERITRQGQPYSLMHLDLDLFKQVNDTMGHAAGDAVLRQVSRIMLEETRRDDTAARVGGDEFVIVCANLVRPSRLAELAERLIRRIEEPIPFGDAECKISVSIGIAIVDGVALSAAEVIDRADVALYASKRAGRARFSFYDGPEETVVAMSGEKK